MPYQPTWVNPYMPLGGTGGSAWQQPSTAQNAVWSPYQQPVNGVIKVNGPQSAMQYQLPPNSMSPALFDNNGEVFYIVSTDGTGTKSLETFDFSLHEEERPIRVDGATFSSQKEFDQFAAKVSAVLGGINAQPVHEPVRPAAAEAAAPVSTAEPADVQTDHAGKPAGAHF